MMKVIGHKIKLYIFMHAINYSLTMVMVVKYCNINNKLLILSGPDTYQIFTTCLLWNKITIFDNIKNLSLNLFILCVLLF